MERQHCLIDDRVDVSAAAIIQIVAHHVAPHRHPHVAVAAYLRDDYAAVEQQVFSDINNPDRAAGRRS